MTREVLGWNREGKEGCLGQDHGESGERLLGKLTLVLQDRCLRLSPKQYLPPMVGLEGAGDNGEMRQW